MPDNATGFVFFARDLLDPTNTCTFNSTSVPAKTGCWEYTAIAIYPDDCVNRATFRFCTNLLPDISWSSRSLEDKNVDVEIKIYPTLFDNVLNFEVSSENFKDFQIFSSSGQVIHTQEIDGSGIFSVDSYQYQSGLYIVTVSYTHLTLPTTPYV